ncbi:hypothetical protein B0H19DRAFT_433428 [Mycena capillaripes]|nr:hypothetical protein B0H19DRAFT_479917 [Mycena capillaripes]KAJ6535648.1 hypothetical protein B0H19DRAFT_433428 [Mycena capillaripes]
MCQSRTSSTTILIFSWTQVLGRHTGRGHGAIDGDKWVSFLGQNKQVKYMFDKGTDWMGYLTSHLRTSAPYRLAPINGTAEHVRGRSV